MNFLLFNRVKMKSLDSSTYFVIMSSVFDTPKTIHIKYDLKGSTIGRLTSPEDCAKGAVQKDLNLMESKRKIRLGPENIDIFYNTLKADVDFLKELNIMDYSLLVSEFFSDVDDY
jgi:1-phosphatidylinositol-4-phosphate 5-kinase